MLFRSILRELAFPETDPIHDEVNNLFVEIEWMTDSDASQGYNWVYDQIVSIGELVATRIVSGFLQLQQLDNTWLDVRDVLRTDNTYREGKVDWDITAGLISKKIKALFEKSPWVITQGFIGATSENFTTTLGREGSDYTAAIFSYCLDAREMTEIGRAHV